MTNILKLEAERESTKYTTSNFYKRNTYIEKDDK